MQIKAKKHFGQNFLKNESIKNKIIQSIPDSKKIVEIGAGLGDLTHGLLAKCEQLVCFEIDSDLIEHLKSRFSHELEGKMQLINADALKVWGELSKQPYFLAANLPYYVATNIILKALRDKNCSGFVVMIQREVAQKFCAKDAEQNSLSLLSCLYGECELLFDVEPECFEPAPKVTSSVIKLVKNKEPDCDIAGFESFLKSCFAAPRKTLAKNLLAIAQKERILRIFEQLGIKESIRAHELNLALFLKIFDEVRDAKRQ